MSQAGFSNWDGPEPALLGWHLSREQLGPWLDPKCLFIEPFPLFNLSVEHSHCSAVCRWLVKTWDICIIQNLLGDRDQLGLWRKKSLPHQRRAVCFVKIISHRKAEQSSKAVSDVNRGDAMKLVCVWPEIPVQKIFSVLISKAPWFFLGLWASHWSSLCYLT